MSTTSATNADNTNAGIRVVQLLLSGLGRGTAATTGRTTGRAAAAPPSMKLHPMRQWDLARSDVDTEKPTYICSRKMLDRLTWKEMSSAAGFSESEVGAMETLRTLRSPS